MTTTIPQSDKLLEDLHALERFLRGCRPGFGRTFASELLRSLDRASERHVVLDAPMKELTRRVQEFVEAEVSASVNGFELWSRIEQAIAACRAGVAAAERNRRTLASSSLIRQRL